MRELRTYSLLCLADIHRLPATTMQKRLIAITNDVPGITCTDLKSARNTNRAMDHSKVEPRIPNNLDRDDKIHSNEHLEKHKLTDLDKCRIYDCEYELDRRSSTTGDRQCELHKKEDLYGNESITRRVVYGEARRAADLKFKCVRDSRDWMDPIGRTMVRVRAIAAVGLFLAVLATCAAAPAKSRPTRSHHHEKSMRSYLENFGYLRKGRPEVSNLVMGDQMQSYEDDFRIAIKTLQEFGGIPVTGEIDSETLELMKQKRCGRPDREEGDDEFVRRRKRFAIQGSKWEHTNLTWSLSQDKRPSQLDAGHTRAVLARALDVWQQASRLTFTQINSNQADIVVSFAKRYHDDAYPFDGRGSILAHAFFPGSGRGGDAHFDDDELWLLQPKNDDEEGTSLFAVAAHEFGHSLGLSHSSVRGALMFPWYQGIQSNFMLPEDDRNGIQQMYGPKEANKWGKIPYYPVNPPPPTTTTSTTTTTRRPMRHNTRHPQYRPSYPREPSRHPSRQPERPDRPHYYPTYPDSPTYYPRHRYNSSEEQPRTHHHHPRPTETTTLPTTYRPRYTGHQDYPSYRPNTPTNPRHDYPGYRPNTPTDPRQDYPGYRPNTPTDPKQDYPSYRPNTPTDPRQDFPRRPYHPEKTTTIKPTTTPKPDIPDSCDTSYDAVTLIRSELFIFKGKYHWRIGALGRYKGYPMEIRRMWPGLPKNLTHVDAVYERPDQKIAIFVGKHLYLFNVQTLERGYPKSLHQLGLPRSLEKLDGAMIWGHNSKTYFYSGMVYWKYDEATGSVEPDYPRNMIMWRGVGYNIDSVFQWKDGKTYFFKGKGFWKFNDLQMQVEREEQLPSAQFWMGCQPERPATKATYRGLAPPGTTRRSHSASVAHNTSTNILLLFNSSIFLILKSYLKYI